MSDPLNTNTLGQSNGKSGKNRFNFGPAILVTAAFIGPGTVMTASKAGAQYGFTLLWAILFSVITAIVLQEMAARLGIVSKAGLAFAIQSTFSNPWTKWPAVLLVLGAILFGNCAYQTGNILGAATGMELLTGFGKFGWSIAISLIAVAVIMFGRFAIIQNLLTALVALMGVLFVFCAILCGPELSAMVEGLKPSIPAGSEWVIIGLIGTTVVPYNLFLHASAAASKYSDEGKSKENVGLDDESSTLAAVRHSLVDTVIAIFVGGVITSALLITAAVAFREAELAGPADIAKQLRPGLGAWAEWVFAIGLFAAGLTSSITAPIAAAFATAGCFGWEPKLSNVRLQVTAVSVVAIGLTCALLFGSSPTEAIIVAQVANGLLLPIVAVFLIYVLNRKQLLGRFTNGWFGNILGVVVVLATILMAARQFHSVWNKLLAMWQ